MKKITSIIILVIVIIVGSLLFFKTDQNILEENPIHENSLDQQLVYLQDYISDGKQYIFSVRYLTVVGETPGGNAEFKKDEALYNYLVSDNVEITNYSVGTNLEDSTGMNLDDFITLHFNLSEFYDYPLTITVENGVITSVVIPYVA